MTLDPKTGELSPVDFSEISNQLPELIRFDLDIKTISFTPPIDSSEVEPECGLSWHLLLESTMTNLTVCYTARNRYNVIFCFSTELFT
jgi:hypothetical protein